MQLQEIKISNFRNLRDVELKLDSHLNIFHGANGQGKTNLLESIFYLVTGRSFRSHLESAVRPNSADPDAITLIEGKITRASGGRNNLRVVISPQGKRIFIDDKPVAQLGSLWGKLRAVLFSPDDLLILKEGPGLRRKLMDIALSQMDSAYLNALQNYTKALRQRNQLLRDGADRPNARELISAFNAPLAKYGAAIFEKRERFLAELAIEAATIYSQIAPSSERMNLRYQSAIAPKDCPANDALLQLLEANLESDLRRRQTLRGVHREDILIQINDADIRSCGSQGQQRTAMLALRLAELKLMQQWTGESAILLLDDLASELDQSRRSRLFDLIDPQVQTILTTTDPELVGNQSRSPVLFEVLDGCVSREF